MKVTWTVIVLGILLHSAVNCLPDRSGQNNDFESMQSESEKKSPIPITQNNDYYYRSNYDIMPVIILITVGCFYGLGFIAFGIVMCCHCAGGLRKERRGFVVRSNVAPNYAPNYAPSPPQGIAQYGQTAVAKQQSPPPDYETQTQQISQPDGAQHTARDGIVNPGFFAQSGPSQPLAKF